MSSPRFAPIAITECLSIFRIVEFSQKYKSQFKEVIKKQSNFSYFHELNFLVDKNILLILTLYLIRKTWSLPSIWFCTLEPQH